VDDDLELRLAANEAVFRATARDDERIRSHPRRFLILPGHEVPEIETVVETEQDYVVVEKLDDEAGALVEDSDPRG
jgi:hypothetical protein